MVNLKPMLCSFLCLITISTLNLVISDADHAKWDTSDSLLLEKGILVVKTEYGYVKVWSPVNNTALRNDNLLVALVGLEGRTVSLPAYFPAKHGIHIIGGNGRLGLIHKGDGFEVDVRAGDVYAVPDGYLYYFVNIEASVQLQILVVAQGINQWTQESFLPFFLSGGADFRGVLEAFDDSVLVQSFKASREDVDKILFNQNQGPIIKLPEGHSLLKIKKNKETPAIAQLFSQWSQRRYSAAEPPIPFNLVDEDHDIDRPGGWASVANSDKSTPLRRTNLGAFAVSLQPGSLLAPHYNPVATEVAIVTRGIGTVQVIHPNGTSALKTTLEKGDVFVVPQFYPVSQQAATSDVFEFIGISTSASTKPPFFLAGHDSLLGKLNMPLLSVLLNNREEDIKAFLVAQDETDIISSTARLDDSHDTWGIMF